MGRASLLQENGLVALANSTVQCVCAGGPSELIGIIGNLFVNAVYAQIDTGYLTTSIQTVTQFVLESAEQDPHYTQTYNSISVVPSLCYHSRPSSLSIAIAAPCNRLFWRIRLTSPRFIGLLCMPYPLIIVKWYSLLQLS